jgi:ABC-type transport system involved in multi-copper enzyme maturation permease subunit
MSPIHDQTYRRYQGTRQPLGRAWTVIAWAGIRNMLSRKGFTALMIVAWAPFIVRAVQMYFVTNYPQAATFVPVDAQMFRTFLEQQGIFVFFVTIYAGAGLIANDRRANALQIYLSKPLMRIEYIGGKLGVLTFYLLIVTLLPGMLLILLQILFSGSFDFISANLFLIPAITLASFLRVFVSAFTMLALSSLSKSSRYVSIMYAGAIFFTEAMFAVLRIILGTTRVAWVSVSANIEQVTDAIFRHSLRYETPVVVSLLVLLGLVALSISVLERRVRGVEVVA